jgi:dimethylargininase
VRIAITRKVSASFANCELTYLERQPIDINLARTQHRLYEMALADAGCKVISLPEEPDLPDSVFVEDVAIVLDEVAVITRPGADSRRPEVESVARALAPYRKLLFIQEPGTIDGGDVLKVDKTLYVGLSGRTNRSALEQIRTFLAPYQYDVKGVEVTGCLHLKSAVTQVTGDTLLINPAWANSNLFTNMRIIETDPSEPHAANTLMIGDSVIYPSGFPATQCRMESHGIRPRIIDASEVIKAEGAVTCCSIVFAN